MIKYRFNAILISGGGNDLVDENLVTILNDWGDELHSTERVSKKIAARLLPRLCQTCPGNFQAVFPLG